MKLFCLIFFASIASAQFFDPVIDDKTYLDKIEEQIKTEVENSAVELIKQTKDTEKVTESYILIKLKDNVFRALRTLAQAEAVAFQENLSKSSRVGRQEAAESSGTASSGSGSGDTETVESEGGSEGGDDESATEKATTPLNGLSTAVKINQNVFQFIGEAIKTIFKGVGGKKSYVRGGSEEVDASSSKLTEALPILMKKPYADQLVGILSLLASENAAPKKEDGKREDRFPFNVLFGNRGRKSDAPDTNGVTDYIENLKQSHPLLFHDLYRGISEPQGLLTSMSKVVAGIQDEIHT